jgi:hypothetical protein
VRHIDGLMGGDENGPNDPLLLMVLCFGRLQREEVMRHLFVAAMVFAVAPAVAQDREKPSSTEYAIITQLIFKAPDAAVQKLLPPGFELNAPAAGPSKGFNFAIILLDHLMSQNPEGKPLPHHTTIPMTIPATNPAVPDRAILQAK